MLEFAGALGNEFLQVMALLFQFLLCFAQFCDVVKTANPGS